MEQSPQPRPKKSLGTLLRENAATVTLILLNLFIFGLMVYAGISWILPSSEQLISWGANYAPLTVAGEWWRMFTCAFLHFGIVHLLSNMLCLLFLGMMVESLLGWRNLFAVYGISAIGCSFASLWFHPMSVAVGASGAIFGLSGAWAAVLIKNHNRFPQESLGSWRNSLLKFIGLNVILGVIHPEVDLAGHLGGLFTGFACAWVADFQIRKERYLNPQTFWVLFALVMMILVSYFPLKKQLWGRLVVRSLFAYETQDWDQCIEKTNLAMNLGPPNAVQYFFLGFCWEIKNDSQKALETYEKILDLKAKALDEETESHAYYAMAHCCEELGQNTEAQVNYNLAIQAGKETDYGSLARAGILKYAGKTKEAVELLKQLQKEQKDNSQDWKADLLLLRASCYEELKNYTAAKQDLNSAKQLKRGLSTIVEEHLRRVQALSQQK